MKNLLLLPLFALTACAVSLGPPRTRAEALPVGLFDASGASVGSVVLTADSTGMQFAFDLHDLPPGEHGVHIHATGKCDRPDFLTAGSHLDEGMHHHGRANPDGPHLGDLPGIVVGADGRARVTLHLDQRGKRPLSHFLFDADGSALIIHAAPDDQHTDPSGQSGPRIACGILT